VASLRRFAFGGGGDGSAKSGFLSSSYLRRAAPPDCDGGTAAAAGACLAELGPAGGSPRDLRGSFAFQRGAPGRSQSAAWPGSPAGHASATATTAAAAAAYDSSPSPYGSSLSPPVSAEHHLGADVGAGREGRATTAAATTANLFAEFAFGAA